MMYLTGRGFLELLYLFVSRKQFIPFKIITKLIRSLRFSIPAANTSIVKDIIRGYISNRCEVDGKKLGVDESVKLLYSVRRVWYSVTDNIDEEMGLFKVCFHSIISSLSSCFFLIQKTMLGIS